MAAPEGGASVVHFTNRKNAPLLFSTADALVQELGQVSQVLREGEPEERKRVVRCFLQGIRIEKATRQAVLRWYRLPRASFVKLVELRGVEPLTPRLPALCSPN